MGIKVSGTRVFEQKIKTLQQKTRKTKNARVTVGYAQTYAVYVHEDTTKGHTTGQAKFLETAARSFKTVLAEDISNGVKQGEELQQVLLEAGRVLLNASNSLVPVLTGALKASGFVCPSSQEDTQARRAFAASEAIRIARGGKAGPKHLRPGGAISSGFPLSSGGRRNRRKR